MPLSGKVALRSIWQLNPRWNPEIEQQIVFIDSDWQKLWPLSSNRLKFIQHWSRQCQAKLTFGTLQDLTAASRDATIIREEYPACADWPGEPGERSWLYPMPDKPFTSFSNFFKKVNKSGHEAHNKFGR